MPLVWGPYWGNHAVIHLSLDLSGRSGIWGGTGWTVLLIEQRDEVGTVTPKELRAGMVISALASRNLWQRF